MKRITLILIVVSFLAINLTAGNVYNVREVPSEGEYATITEAMVACSDPSDPALRDTIDVMGTFTGTYVINKSVVIRGHGWENTILQGASTAPTAVTSATGPVISISAGASPSGYNVDISNLTVRYGKVDANATRGAGIQILNNKTGKIVMQDLNIHNNFAIQAGGLGVVATNVDILRCYIHTNSTTDNGAGIGIYTNKNVSGSNAVVNVYSSTVTDNVAGGAAGGGIAVDGHNSVAPPGNWLLEVVITNSTIVNNISKSLGGGISLKGAGLSPTETNTTLRLDYSTISYNAASIYDGNTSHVGLGGVAVANGLPKVYIKNSIIALNISDATPRNDVNFGKIQPQEVKNSLFGLTNAFPEFAVNTVTDIESSVLKLDTELRNKEVNVPVLPILSGSVAIDYITTNENVEMDQRGWSRELLKSDVGSYEFKKVSALEINALKTTLALSENTQISIAPTPCEADSTGYIYQVTGNAVSVSSIGEVTPLQYGTATVVVKSVDNPDVLSNELLFTVSVTSSEHTPLQENISLLNPFTEKLILQNGKETDWVTIYSISGKTIYSGNYISTGISAPNLQTGLYILNIKRLNGEVYNLKALKN